ncbi:MAG: hypothetical protein HKL90_05810 [Elusimicrobia bacterium]|nr:hypothetical protein [Elusimicrobiota bacterium]
MAKLKPLFAFVFGNFGPVIVFYAANHYRGLAAGITASAIYSISEIILKFVKKQTLPPLFKYTAAMTMIFGGVDLWAQRSILFKYEGGVTHLITGFVFAGTLFSGTPLLEEFYRQSPAAKPMTPELRSYFRFLTGLWVAYFFFTAVLFFWFAWRFSLEKSVLLRSVVGTGSLCLLLLISIKGSRFIFPALRKRGLLNPGKAVG